MTEHGRRWRDRGGQPPAERGRFVPVQNRVDVWPSPPESLTLEKDEIHVWRGSLDASHSRAPLLRETLSQDERERADRFHFSSDRERFIVARGVLRAILGRYLHMEPSQIQFSYGPRGKPSLIGDVDALSFNSSHSRDLVLCAVARGREVGIDVEHVGREIDAEAIAERFFSPREIATLISLPQEARRQAFFACWTRKEAYVKARGDGFTMPLDSFSVSFSPGEPAALLDVEGHADEPSRWSLSALHPDRWYAAALAVEGPATRLTTWNVDARTIPVAT